MVRSSDYGRLLELGVRHRSGVAMIASRRMADLEPETRRRVAALKACMGAMGHPVFMYCSFRDLEQQQREVEDGDSEIRHGYHNLRHPDTGEPAAQAADLAFSGSRPWDARHPWALLRRVAEAVGLEVPIPEGDAGHVRWTGHRAFSDLWAAQEHHHEEMTA